MINELHLRKGSRMMPPQSEISDTPDPDSHKEIRAQMSLFRANLLYLEEHKYTNYILSVIMVSYAYIFIMCNNLENGIS